MTVFLVELEYMKIKIYFFGKKTEITDDEKEYLRRINFRCECELIPLSQAGLTDGGRAKKVEAEKLLPKLSDSDYLIAWDERGKSMDSPHFAEFLEGKLEERREVVMVIGGAYGLDESVRSRADVLIRASDMIWTRNLFRLMCLEQVYRALEIQGGGNFHKA